MMYDRFIGVICVVVGLVMAITAKDYQAAIAYEPIGPKAFPLILALMLILLGLSLAIKPTLHQVSFSVSQLKTTGLAMIGILLFALLFQWLGFILSTWMMTILLARAFGGTWKNGTIYGLGLSLGLFVLFDRLLDVILPVGAVFKYFA